MDTFDKAHSDMAWCRPLNPFHFDPSWKIPVPGCNAVACSMESTWQGTKLVDGVDAPEMFRRPPYKRPPDEQRFAATYRYADSVFRYGDQAIDLVAARYLIYVPAYLHVLDAEVPASVLKGIEARLAAGSDVFCFDWDSNMDIGNANSPFSHSALLAAFFNGTLDTFTVQYASYWRFHHGQPAPDLPLTRYHNRRTQVRIQ